MRLLNILKGRIAFASPTVCATPVTPLVPGHTAHTITSANSGGNAAMSRAGQVVTPSQIGLSISARAKDIRYRYRCRYSCESFVISERVSQTFRLTKCLSCTVQHTQDQSRAAGSLVPVPASRLATVQLYIRFTINTVSSIISTGFPPPPDSCFGVRTPERGNGSPHYPAPQLNTVATAARCPFARSTGSAAPAPRARELEVQAQ